MRREERAKQFIPFDALKGFREALEEKERLITTQKELSKDQKEELNRKLFQIKRNEMITIEFFCKGKYVQVTDTVLDIDFTNKRLKMQDRFIPFDDISEIIL